MKKKEIKILAQQSYNNNELNEKIVTTIVEKLSRKDLKEYIRSLKILEKQKEVIIALPNIKSYNKKDAFSDTLFKSKRIIVEEDSSLILGAKITDNDLVYELNLKNNLEHMTKNIEQGYE